MPPESESAIDSVKILQIITAPANLVCENTDGSIWPIVCLALVEDKDDGDRYVIPMDMCSEGDIQLLFLGDKNVVRVFIRDQKGK